MRPWSEINPEAFGNQLSREQGEATLAYAKHRGVPLMNMQMTPRHGTTGKTVSKSAAELAERSGQSHVTGSGLATGRVGPRLREQMRTGNVTVRPSMRSQMLSDTEDTYSPHDMMTGHRMTIHPDIHEDAEVRAAGLPPLRASSRAGFMPGLGSVAMHKQEMRAHQANADMHATALGALERQHGNAARRQKAALARGDTKAASQHGATMKELQGQMRGKGKEVAAAQKMAEHHGKQAAYVAESKVHAIRMLGERSRLEQNPSLGAAALEAHKGYFDPETKEEFYPLASQAQLGEAAERGGTSQTTATNLTAMTSAQRSWRRRDPYTDVVTHPNLEMASHVARHVNDLKAGGHLEEGSAWRKGATEKLLAHRELVNQANYHAARARAARGEGDWPEGPKPIKTDVTTEDLIAHTLPPPGGQMGLAATHGRQAARMTLAGKPSEMADVWAEVDPDKRPTFALALAASHPSKAVRRQSVQAMTVDTHRSKELGVEYEDVLGTGKGMHRSALQELPHQPGKSVQPAYNYMAMLGTRSALQMTSKRFKEGGDAVTPRYAQENPWGLFAAENMQDVQRALKQKREGGTEQIRERASGYYREQTKAPEHRNLGRQFSDEELFS